MGPLTTLPMQCILLLMKTTTNKAAHHSIPASHFSATVKRALAKKGILLVGMCTIPNWETGEYSNGETGYQLDDNGTGRIRTLLEVLAIAGDEKAAESCRRIAAYREEMMAAQA